MIPRALRPVLFAAGIAAVAALPLLGRAVRSGGEARCALDGIRIPPATLVRLGMPGGEERLFCCIDCAARWVERRGEGPETVLLTDETAGAPVPAGEAWLVESGVASNAPAGCFVHVFASENDARRHAEAFGGRILKDHPLAPPGGSTR